MSASSPKGTITPYVIKTIELGLPVCDLANLLASSSSSAMMLSEESIHTDAIAEAFRRILEEKAPLIIEREVVPGNPDTRESFSLKDLLLDKSYVRACLEFRLDNALLARTGGLEELIEGAKKWDTAVQVEGPVYEEN